MVGNKHPHDDSATGRSAGLADLDALNRELAGLALAGVPLEPGLRQLARRDGAAGRAAKELADWLETGMALPDALDRLGTPMPRWYQAVVAAGLRSGRLGDVLFRLNSHLSRQIETRRRLVEAMWYPVVIVAAAIAFVTMAVLWAYPQMAEARAALVGTLPGGAPPPESTGDRMMETAHVLVTWSWALRR